MNKNDKTLAQELSSIYYRLNLIFHVILAPPLIAFIGIYLEFGAGRLLPAVENELYIRMLSFALPVLTFGVIVGAFMTFKKRLRSILLSLPMPRRMRLYAQKSIVLYMMLAMGLALNLAGYYLIQKNIFLAMYMVVLIFFSIYKPTLGRIADHLQIDGEDRNFLINCRSIARGEGEEASTHTK